MEEGQKGKAETMFNNFGKKVDNFVVELNEAGDKLRQEFQQRFEELKDSAEKIKKESQNKERWKEVEENLQHAAEELKKALEAAFKKRSN